MKKIKREKNKIRRYFEESVLLEWPDRELDPNVDYGYFVDCEDDEVDLSDLYNGQDDSDWEEHLYYSCNPYDNHYNDPYYFDRHHLKYLTEYERTNIDHYGMFGGQRYPFRDIEDAKSFLKGTIQ